VEFESKEVQEKSDVRLFSRPY